MKEIFNYSKKTVYFLVIISLFICCSSNKSNQGIADIPGPATEDTSWVIPLPQAFAHNDYAHKNPLFDALANGFTTIEADIHLIEGELYVTHDPPASLEDVSTLKDLYLNPLREVIRENGGFVYPGYESPVYLMIDFKTEAESTYSVLRKQLMEFSDMLSSPLEIFISGNRPIQTIKKDTDRLAGVDGRPADLEKNYSADLMPVISDNISNIVEWNGIDPITEEEFEKLKSLSNEVHQQGKKFRLWAAPENDYTWEVLLAAGIDFVCTDDLEKARIFLIEHEKNISNN